MNAPHPLNLLKDTIRYLEQQKSRGLQFVRIDPNLLKNWTTSSSLKTQKTKTSSIPPMRSSKKSPMSAERRAAFEALKIRATSCQKCPHLVKFRSQVVFGVGNLDAELMFVGEAPGADEDKQGEPFVGRAGQLLTKMIQTMGFERADIYIGNVLKCRPDIQASSGNRKPTAEEMATCVPYLQEQIQLIQPRVLVAVGDTAVKGLFPSLKETISRLRGNWLEYEGIPLMPTFHPSYLLHNQSLVLKRQCWEDLLKVMEKLGEPISEKQRHYFLSAITPPSH